MMFLNNKYTKWYYLIINNRLNNPHNSCTYTERHHIIPKSLGGDNSKENLIRLSAREHFLVHWLLTKMCVSKNHEIKMNHAIIRLMGESSKSEAHIWSKWQYEKASDKKRFALAESRRNGKDPRKGKKHSDEAKEKMRQAKLGKKRPDLTVAARGKREHSQETKEKIIKTLQGRPVSEETKTKLSKSLKGKPQNRTIMTCSVCGAENYATQIKRCHNDNCKKAKV
jgi:hypothetical protein